MATTPWIPTVQTIQDGQNVDAATTNAVFNQLIQRDQYLFERFDDQENKAALIMTHLPVHPDHTGDVAVSRAVYYLKDNNGEGLAPAVVQYSSSQVNSLYAPGNSCFVLGVVRSTETTAGLMYADVFLNGYISITMADIMETGSTFAVGPYYLSAKEVGKVSQAPGGMAIYVGYATSATEMLLGPHVDELSEFYINYRFTILDRPNGTPINYAGTWVIANPDVTPHNPPATTGAINRVGWIPVADIPTNIVPTSSIPTDAKFFYGLPAALLTTDLTEYAALDNPGISDDEKLDAKLLLMAWPPVPLDLTFLFGNGIVQTPRSDEAPSGIYSVDQFGIWWYNDQDPYQPWASDLPPTWVPSDWPTNKGSEAMRMHLLMQFVKFNPAVRAAIVASMAAYNDSTNNSTNVLKFYDRDSGAEASVGDLKVKFNLPISSSTESPVTPTAVKTIEYNQVTGQLEIETSPVITGISAGNGINVVVSGTGGATISTQTIGLNGQVDSLEPENARLEYLGLHSYLNLVNPATLSTGLVGKLLLPPSIATGDLNLVLFLFGKSSTGSLQSISFNFYYSVATPISLVGADPNLNYLISSATTAGSNPISIDLPAAAYTAYNMFYVAPATMIVPAAKLTGDTWVNFRLTRIASTYTGDVGVVGVYWKINI